MQPRWSGNQDAYGVISRVGVSSVGTRDRGVSHVLGGTRPEGERFHRAAQNVTQLKPYEVSISEIFHFTRERGLPWLTNHRKRSHGRGGGGCGAAAVPSGGRWRRMAPVGNDEPVGDGVSRG